MAFYDTRYLFKKMYLLSCQISPSPGGILFLVRPILLNLLTVIAVTAIILISTMASLVCVKGDGVWARLPRSLKRLTDIVVELDVNGGDRVFS